MTSRVAGWLARSEHADQAYRTGPTADAADHVPALAQSLRAAAMEVQRLRNSAARVLCTLGVQDDGTEPDMDAYLDGLGEWPTAAPLRAQLKMLQEGVSGLASKATDLAGERNHNAELWREMNESCERLELENDRLRDQSTRRRRELRRLNQKIVNLQGLLGRYHRGERFDAGEVHHRNNQLKAELERARRALGASPDSNMGSYAEAVAAEDKRLRELTADAQEWLTWCGASSDFGPGGKARAGWVKSVQPLLARLQKSREGGGSGQ